MIRLKRASMAAALAVAAAAAPTVQAQEPHVGHGSGPAPAAGDVHGEHVLAPTAPPPDGQRRILYYRNPMGLPDTSPIPKKDPMGMDYVPVYEDEATEAGAGVVTIGPERVQKLGVRTEPVQRRVLERRIRAVGTVQADERTLYVVAPKFEAWIERLLVDTTGAPVRKGQALMEIYSPELFLAQQEYLVARRSLAGMEGMGGEAEQPARLLAEAALQRLRNLDVPEEEIERLRKTGKASRTLVYRSPAGGVVLEKTAVRGMRFSPGEPLYRIADLSGVWVLADVFEQDLGAVQLGHPVQVMVNALSGRVFSGTIDFIYPTLAAESRTGKVRIPLANEEGHLRLNLYATVELHTEVGPGPQLTVPESALLDTGKRQVVLVEAGDGRYQPREVQVAARGDGYVQVDGGLAEGERVVVRANFLIDSESNLRSALGAFGAQHQHQ